MKRLTRLALASTAVLPVLVALAAMRNSGPSETNIRLQSSPYVEDPATCGVDGTPSRAYIEEGGGSIAQWAGLSPQQRDLELSEWPCEFISGDLPSPGEVEVVDRNGGLIRPKATAAPVALASRLDYPEHGGPIWTQADSNGAFLWSLQSTVQKTDGPFTDYSRIVFRQNGGTNPVTLSVRVPGNVEVTGYESGLVTLSMTQYFGPGVLASVVVDPLTTNLLFDPTTATLRAPAGSPPIDAIASLGIALRPSDTNSDGLTDAVYVDLSTSAAIAGTYNLVIGIDGPLASESVAFTVSIPSGNATQAVPIPLPKAISFGAGEWKVFGAFIRSTANPAVGRTVNPFSAVIPPFVGSNRPPVCSSPTLPNRLWPPNHTLQPIPIGGVADPDNDPVTVRVTAITQDEPTNGTGSGDTAPDGTIDANGLANVRAERAGNGDGRVYRLSFTATDARGASCSGFAFVNVPPNNNGTALDSGQQFNSLQ